MPIKVIWSGRRRRRRDASFPSNVHGPPTYFRGDTLVLYLFRMQLSFKQLKLLSSDSSDPLCRPPCQMSFISGVEALIIN